MNEWTTEQKVREVEINDQECRPYLMRSVFYAGLQACGQQASLAMETLKPTGRKVNPAVVLLT